MAGPKIIRLVGPDGVPAYHEWPAMTPLPEGAVWVSRWPGPFEDRFDGAWVRDHRGKADAEVPRAHIEEARALKYLEALAVLSGVELATGLLKLEAQQRGLTVQELAEMVLAKRVDFIRREVRRQVRQENSSEDYEIPDNDPLAGL